MERVRRTKIICTLGPACGAKKEIVALLHAGMNVARLNFSHSKHAVHAERIAALREAEKECEMPVAILLDSRGPELRTGEIADSGEIELRRTQRVILHVTEQDGTVDSNQIAHLNINYPLLPSLIEEGMHIYVADGLIDLRATNSTDEYIECIVENGGVVGSYKNINVPGLSLPLPAISNKDLEDISFGIKHGIDIIALSFVRRAADLVPVRNLTRSRDSSIRIIAKIENEEGVQNIDEIISVADGIMIARGDLGIQLSADRVALVQKEIIRRCNRAGKTVITATQMLESMTEHARPTRPEMTDVANAIFDGSDALMLSAETAIGKHPALAVQTLDSIARSVERSAEFRNIHEKLSLEPGSTNSSSEAVAKATALLAGEIEAKTIIVLTHSGSGPRWIARCRPYQPIVAIATTISTVRALLLDWGVIPLLCKEIAQSKQMIDVAFDIACKHGYSTVGDWTVISAGLPLDSPISLNTIYIRHFGHVLCRGSEGFGKGVRGEIVILERESDIEETSHATARSGSRIAVAHQIEKWMVPHINAYTGIISELPLSWPPNELLALNNDLVVVAGVSDALVRFTNGQHVHMRGFEKSIYEE